jgi:hypothetical protein
MMLKRTFESHVSLSELYCTKAFRNMRGVNESQRADERLSPGAGARLLVDFLSSSASGPGGYLIKEPRTVRV